MDNFQLYIYFLMVLNVSSLALIVFDDNKNIYKWVFFLSFGVLWYLFTSI
jgi:hypothetical protein